MTGPLRPPEIRCLQTTLSNGLDVLVRRQPGLPLVAVNLWYHVGSKDEERRQRGFAHLFEHLMFEGSEHYPGDFFKPLQRVGASLNGSTSTDRTNYFEDLPAAQLELALAMESDRMGHFLPALDESKLRIQKDVVKNEYRQNYANRPYGLVWKLLAEALFPPTHPYSWLTIGAMEDVEAATMDDVEGFFRRFYVPSNASLAIVGDLEEARALELAERYFGPIPGGLEALPPWAPAADLDTPRSILYHDRVELDRTYEVWPTVPYFHEEDAPLSLLADVLGRGRSSRLYRRLVVDEQVAQDVTAYHSSRQLAGGFGIVLTLRPGKDWRTARALALEDLHDLAEHGPTPEELERVRNGRLAGFIYALDNIGGFGGVADRLNAYNTYLKQPESFGHDLERFQKATADDIRRVAQRHLAERSSVALTVLGRKPATVLPPLDRAVPPQAAAAVPFRAPSPEVIALVNGATLWVLPRRDLPIVAGTLVVPAGASAHGPERGGLAGLTAEMMDEGTTSLPARELALAAERLGTALSSSCGWDGSYVGFQCLTPHLQASLELTVDVALRPSFPENEWRRVQAQAIAGLRAERDSAEARSQRALLRLLYPEGHPYRVPVDGDLGTVASCTREDLTAFHKAHYLPQGAAWVIAGDVDPEALARQLNQAHEGWAGAAPERLAVLRPAHGSGPRLVLLDRPGSAQAVVRVGHVGTHRLDPDYEDLLVLNQILGGQFTSRLNTRLREEKGLTYGVRSQFDTRRADGPFSISASVQTDRVAEALAELFAEIELLVGDAPPTLVELEDARRSLIEGQARHFENPSALVARYAGLWLHGLPPDHHARYAERLQGVHVEGLAEAARRQVHPELLVAVVVADAELVEGPLARLGWGTVERLADEAQG